MVSSARGAIEEGVYTASLRLVEATSRLATIGPELAPDDFVQRLGALIRARGNDSYLDSQESWVAFLDELLGLVASEIRNREPPAGARDGA